MARVTICDRCGIRMGRKDVNPWRALKSLPLPTGSAESEGDYCPACLASFETWKNGGAVPEVTKGD